MVIEEVRGIFAPPNFFGSDMQFRRWGLLEICGKMPPSRENSYNLVICSPESDQIKNLKTTYRRVQTLRISLKNVQMRRP